MIPKKICDNCLISKQPTTSFSSNTMSKASDVLHVVYSYVCGPFDAPLVGEIDNLYHLWMILVEKLWLHLIKAKSEVFNIFKGFKALVEK